MLVAGLIAYGLMYVFSFVFGFALFVISVCAYWIRYAVSPRFRREQREAERIRSERARILAERLERYGNCDAVQYGDSHCAGMGCPGCHCNWDGYDRPPCY